MGDTGKIFCCGPEQDYYPNALRGLAGMPSAMFYRGNIQIINQNINIAVIGTRKLSRTGAYLSYETGQAVGKAGLNLVNGLALGCDTEAIKGALSAGGKCIAVMPCGLEQIYPKTNQKLAEQILEQGGCLLSEYSEGTGIEKYRFVERDRLQSGISQGVVVIEAEKNSGTMHTVNAAIRQQRRLACYYYKFLELSSGNKYMEEKTRAEILKSKEDLEAFLARFSEPEKYEQLEFHFEV